MCGLCVGVCVCVCVCLFVCSCLFLCARMCVCVCDMRRKINAKLYSIRGGVEKHPHLICFILLIFSSSAQKDVSHNSLSNIPTSIGSCTTLRKLLLHRNSISSLPGSIGNLQRLVELTLESNQCSTLPEEIQKLSQLTRLDLRYNKLAKVPRLTAANGLKELYLGYNQLTSLDGCAGFPEQIHVLDIR